MKTKFSVVLISVFLCCNFLCVTPEIVKSQSYNYARITNSETYLYKTTSDLTDINNVYFQLEKTYFVKILEEHNEFYKVSYLDVIGYVVASQVTLINATPNNPYPRNITFNINSSLNTKIRSSASMTNDNNVVGVLPTNNATLTYLGSVQGEESIKTLGNEWYYCYYNYENFGCILGYVYAPLTENLTPILANTETFSSTVENDNSEIPQMPSDQQNIIIIVLMCLPAVIIFILLVIPSKTNNNSQTSHTKTRKRSKKDFYEID